MLLKNVRLLPINNTFVCGAVEVAVADDMILGCTVGTGVDVGIDVAVDGGIGWVEAHAASNVNAIAKLATIRQQSARVISLCRSMLLFRRQDLVASAVSTFSERLWDCTVR